MVNQKEQFCDQITHRYILYPVALKYRFVPIAMSVLYDCDAIYINTSLRRNIYTVV